MAQFCVLFLGNSTLLATRKRLPWHNDPSNTPLDNFLCLLFKNILSQEKIEMLELETLFMLVNTV